MTTIRSKPARRTSGRRRTLLARIGTLGLTAAFLSGIPAHTASAEPIIVDTVDDLADAFADGGDILLGADLVVDATGPDLAIGAGEAIILDLRGHRLEVSGDHGRAGITVTGGTHFTVRDMAGSGELEVTGGVGSAGIGGDAGEDAGTITIEGGTITATGGASDSGSPAGAAIGAGGRGTVGPITITTATVIADASDGKYGPAIGGGYSGVADDITITDATITATAYHGAGIGSAYGGNVGDIRIEDSTVTAASEADGGVGSGAAIGSGSQGAARSITIIGSDVTTAVVGAGAGIGSGHNASVGDITITNSSVAAAAEHGAGIGSGDSGWARDITITDSNVIATAEYGAGIGSGDGLGPSAGSITITDSNVIATSKAGAGIGSTRAYSAFTGDITIDGGTTTAISEDGGAGIGGGASRTGAMVTPGDVIIESGTITAIGGVEAAGIGGHADHQGVDVTIGADATVYASSTDGPAIGAGAGEATFGSLSNAGELILPCGDHLEVPTGIVVLNSGLIRGEGELRGDGEIDNTGSIWHTIDVLLDVSVHDYELGFDANGGRTGPGSGMRVYAATLADAGLDLPADEPIRGGWNFVGWFDGPDRDSADGPLHATSILSTDAAPPDEPIDVTWYAGWSAPEITTPDLPEGQVDDPYEATIDAVDTIGTVTWSVIDGALPDGLALDPASGIIAGTPETDGTFAFTVAVTDEGEAVGRREFSITIAAGPEEPPVEDPPADDPPAEDPPADEPPVGEPPTDQPATEEPPAENRPDDPPPVPAATGGRSLPRTGAPVLPLIALAASAIGVGGVFTTGRRRFRS